MWTLEEKPASSIETTFPKVENEKLDLGVYIVNIDWMCHVLNCMFNMLNLECSLGGYKLFLSFSSSL